MTRLTGHDGENAYMLQCFADGGCQNMGTSECDLCTHMIDFIAKLARYEDTGLEPEEIEKLLKLLNTLR